MFNWASVTPKHPLGHAVGTHERVFHTTLSSRYSTSASHPAPNSFVISNTHSSDISNGSNPCHLLSKRERFTHVDYWNTLNAFILSWFSVKHIQNCELSSDYRIFHLDRNQPYCSYLRCSCTVNSKNSCTSVSLEIFSHLEQVAVSLVITESYLHPLFSADLYTSHSR